MSLLVGHARLCSPGYIAADAVVDVDASADGVDVVACGCCAVLSVCSDECVRHRHPESAEHTRWSASGLSYLIFLFLTKYLHNIL